MDGTTRAIEGDMLITPSRTEERIYHWVREAGSLRATANQIAATVGGDVEDTRVALDEMVSRNELRRFEVPGESSVYWS